MTSEDFQEVSTDKTMSLVPQTLGRSTHCPRRLSSPLRPELEKKQEFVRPRWPYDMRPSVRAEKYIRDAGP